MNPFAGLMAPMVDKPCILRTEPRREPTAPRPLARRFVSTPNPWRMTDLQLRMLELSCGGLSRKEIGDQIGISIKTIDVHLRMGRKKMGARNNVHAAVLFDRWSREHQKTKAEAGLFDGTAPGGDLQVSEA